METKRLTNSCRWFTMFVAGVLLSACAADEMVNRGNELPSGNGETVVSGTVNFSNQTAMTIGGSSAFTLTKALTHDAFYENEACKLDMDDPEEVTLPEGVTPIDNVGNADKPSNVGFFSEDVIIGGNSVCIMSNKFVPEGATLYVQGTLTIEGSITGDAQYSGGGGRIVVMEGGLVEFKNLSQLENIEIVNYGTIIFGDASDDEYTLKEDASLINYGKLCYMTNDDNEESEALPLIFRIEGTFKTNDDLVLMNLVLVGGEFYVGGDLLCCHVNSEREGARMHVIGNLSAIESSDEQSNLEFNAPLDLCVEGTLLCRSLTVSCTANLHLGCNLETDELILNAGATLCANHIKASATELGGTSVAPVTLWLTNLGVAELGALNLLNANVQFKLYGQERGLVTSTSFNLGGFNDLTNVFGDSFYVNYEDIVVDNSADVTFADQSLVNVATLSTTSADGCKPDFTVPEPEPEPEPGDGEIELPIGDIDFDHDFTLLADDFAIRVNGDYMEDIVVDGNTATLNNILIAHGDDMIIKVSGLDETNILEGNDYTYECYIWVNNTKLLDDGTGAYGPLFDEALYEEWVNPSWDPYTNDDFGCDMTSRITGVTSPAGYVVRYNVYRGLSGHVDSDTGYGDTPYLKVSIHVQRDPSAPANTCVGVYPEIK